MKNPMGLSVNYSRKLYDISIDNKFEEIIVSHFAENHNFYFCRFMKDISNGLYDKYDTIGFYVDISNSPRIAYHLSGKLNEAEARNIWTQLELVFDTPKYTAPLLSFNL